MALSGAEISYISGQKNNWRRWMWNQVKERLPKNKTAKDCLVLYLAGRENADLEEAKRRGFLPANMIAVEADKDVARSLRQQGVTTIAGNVVDVLNCWPLEHKVDVVILDLCAGLGLDMIRRVQAGLMQPCFVGAIVSINLQRGRDDVKAFKSQIGSWLSVIAPSLSGALRNNGP